MVRSYLLDMNQQTTAAWLQAGAAILQAGVAIALLVITKRYVDLTARLAASSEAQVEFMRAERELMRAERDQKQQATVNQFRQAAKSLLDRVRQLPGLDPEARQSADRLIRSAILPADADLKDLVTLAATIGPSMGDLARAASDNFLWLLRIARTIQATRPEQGYNYDRLNWNTWVFHYIEAENALAKLAAQ